MAVKIEKMVAAFMFLVLLHGRLLHAGTNDVQKMVENLEKQVEELMDTIDEQSETSKRETTEHRGQVLQRLKRQQSNIAFIKNVLEKQDKALERQDKKVTMILRQSSEIGRMMLGFMAQRGSRVNLDVLRTNPNLNPLSRVAAIPWPSSGAFVVSHGQTKDEVIHIVGNGEIVSVPYSNIHEFDPKRSISGVLLTTGQLNILHKNGTIVRLLLEDSQLNGTFHVDVGELQHTGSMQEESLDSPRDMLLLADKQRGEVFTYDLAKKEKTVHLRGLQEPVSVSYTNTNDGTAYIVCEEGAGVIKTYNASWYHLKTIRPSHGQFFPRSAVMSPRGTILVADAANTVVSEFNIRGRFLQNVLDRQDGIDQPQSMSYSQGILWVSCNADTFSNVKSFRV